MHTKLPQRSGEKVLHGLKHEVQVLFDEWAVPHIEAQNEHDAYLALGYLHAQDRLFQLELMIRVAQEGFLKYLVRKCLTWIAISEP